MLRSDRLSEDVIKIFHNAKGSVRNNISKWTENASTEINSNPELKIPPRSNYDSSPFDHAAGEYEPLPKEHTHPSLVEQCSDSKKEGQSRLGMDDQ